MQQGDNGWELSPGGLVTALRPVMATHPGAWVGWDGGTKGMPATLPDSEVRLLPIGLSAAQVRDYYRGFANATHVAAAAQRDREAPLRALLVARLPGGQPGLRGADDDRRSTSTRTGSPGCTTIT